MNPSEKIDAISALCAKKAAKDESARKRCKLRREAAMAMYNKDLRKAEAWLENEIAKLPRRAKVSE